MNHKKSTISIDMLIYLGIGALIFVVLVIAIPKLIGKGSTEASNNLDGTKDYDGDGISNIFDKCKCKAADTRDGCPGGYDAAQKDASNCNDCPTEQKPAGCPRA